MANVEINDFSENFDRDFRDDVGYIADRSNDALDELDRNYGGQLTDLNRNFGAHRNNFLDLIENIIGNEVMQNRAHLDDILTDAIFAAIAVCAKTIRRGNRDSEDWIANEFENNPFLRDVERSSRRDSRRDEGRRSSRYNNRRSAADYHSRRDRPTERRSERDEGRRSKRRGGGSSTSVPRGRIASITKPRVEEREEEVVEQTQSRPERAQRPAKLENGSVILSTNLAQTGTAYGLLYVAGEEQVEYNGQSLEIAEFTGDSAVDYEQHRIDRFYPDILGDGSKTDLTAVALREAEKVKDQTIKRFVSDPTDENAEKVSDTKLFQHAQSGSYDEVISYPAKQFSHVELREALIEEHTGTPDWFAKHALFVKVEQIISLDGISNDTYELLKYLVETDKVLETVGTLIKLSDKIDPVVWRLLHDYTTTGFNKRLVSLDLDVRIDSISADWNAFRDWLKDNRPELAETLNMKNGILNGMRVYESEGNKFIGIRRDTIYIPIASYDLDFSAATASEGFAVLNDQTKIYNLVKPLMAENIPVLYITTLDGQTMAVRDISGVMGARFYVTKE